MKKDVSLAIIATILVLQLVGNFSDMVFGAIAEDLAGRLSNQLIVEQPFDYEGG